MNLLQACTQIKFKHLVFIKQTNKKKKNKMSHTDEMDNVGNIVNLSSKN